MTVRLVRIVVVLGLVGTLAATLGSWSWVLDLTTHFRPHMAGVLGLCGVAALLTRRFAWAAAAVVLVAVNVAAVAPAWDGRIAASRDAPRALEPLRILHLNAQQGGADKEAVGRYLAASDADVISLVEVDGAVLESLEPYLEDYPHRAFEEAPDGFGFAVYARHPVVGYELLRRPEDSGIPWLRTILDVDGRPWTVVSLHALPPITEAWIRKTDQLLGSIASRVDEMAPRLVVCGDFNLTPWSARFRAFVDETDLRLAGHAPLGTWPAAWLPLRIPIDHCLVDAGLEATAHRVGPNVGSDHLPVEIEIQSRPSSPPETVSPGDGS